MPAVPAPPASPSVTPPPTDLGGPVLPGDAERLRGLRRMKLTATGLLVLAGLVFVATLRQDGVLGFVNAGAEAAMVGALADWFAVTALFRHPLGVPVPHTALIPTRKDALGQSLEEFVTGNFLSEAVVREKVAGAQVAGRLGRWLTEPAHAEQVTREAAAVLRGGLRVLRDEDVADVLDAVLVRRVGALSWSPAAGRLLQQVVADGAHHRLVDLTVDQLYAWLEDNQETVTRIVVEQAPAWTPDWVDLRVAERVHAEALKFVGDVQAEPFHRVRSALDDLLGRFAHDLQHDPETRERAEALKDRLLSQPDVRGATGELWATGRRLLLEAVEDPDSELRRRGAAGVASLGRRLVADPDVQGRVDAFLADAAGHVVRDYAGELVTVISDTVQRWDGEEASRRIELHVGRDLQFIRINGTVVGALVGLLLHTVAVTVG